MTSDALRRVLLDHHPVVRSETGPLTGCRCGQVKLGEDIIAHVAAHVQRLIADAEKRAAAAALGDAADDWDANTNHVCDAPQELRDRAAALDPT